LADPIEVEAGDLIGFMNIAENRGSIAYNIGPQFSLNRDLVFGQKVVPSLGESVDISVFTPSYIYSIGTRVSTHRTLCKYTS
jgi:hypothetical protein